MILKDKNILVGVSGSIAAYKIAFLTRLLVKEGANVLIIMTDGAEAFVSPLTLATLSKNPVLKELFNPETGEWQNHVELGMWADVFLIAPATANTIAKAANGICDNLLLTTYLSARCTVVFAPAMDLDMFLHKSTQKNISILKENGNLIIEPNEGELASGLEGKGRMAEPEEIIENLKVILGGESGLQNKTVLITAGPTQEAIDPVRFISNHSSGKMGFEIAKAFAYAGAKVHLVAGPNNLPDSDIINKINVQNAEEMYQAAKTLHGSADIVVFAAAVADYKPSEIATQKIKKKEDEMSVSLRQTVDIAKELGKVKKSGQIHVGFALETQNEAKNAKEKLQKKNFDLIVLNSLQDKGAGFRYDTNKITIFDRNGGQQSFALKGKEDVAQDIKNAVSAFIKEK